MKESIEVLGRELRMLRPRADGAYLSWSSVFTDGLPHVDATWDGSGWHVYVWSHAPGSSWSIRGGGRSVAEAIAALPVDDPVSLAGGTV